MESLQAKTLHKMKKQLHFSGASALLPLALLGAMTVINKKRNK